MVYLSWIYYFFAILDCATLPISLNNAGFGMTNTGAIAIRAPLEAGRTTVQGRV